MTTAQKRAHFIKTAPIQLNQVHKLIENGEYRELDRMVNSWNDAACISYVITLLCDELVLKEKIISE